MPGSALIPYAAPAAAGAGWRPLLDRLARAVRRSQLGAAPHGPPALLLDALAAEGDDAAATLRAEQLLAAYAAAGETARDLFFAALLAYGPDRSAVRRAAVAFARDPSDEALSRLQALVDPPRQAIIRRLNQAPGGTAALVAMRADLLRRLPGRAELGLADADFAHVFTSWFNRGFLELRRIGWDTPATILEKLIRYEAVHAINGWDDLRRRLDPPDRRCFGFFHPNLPDEPLIFVEVALTHDMPAAIGPILGAGATPGPARPATTAVFYSISNCQEGLRGIAFGNLLIKQAVLALKAELPGLRQFCTLSPVPGLMRWVGAELARPAGCRLADGDRDGLAALSGDAAPELFAEQGKALARAAARYLTAGKAADGRPADPVARFHLGNGAKLDRINTGADLSARGLKQSGGVMVNYVYDPAEVEGNRAAFARDGAVSASKRVRALAATG